MDDFAPVLRCPVSHQPLHWRSSGELASQDGERSYVVRNGVARLLPRPDAANDTQTFYEESGWAEDDGAFGDTKAFTDSRKVPLEFTRRCMSRLTKHFQQGGDYLLDVGSGPLPHDEVLAYSDKFRRRICVDLSAKALIAAQRKVGDKGIYLQGDLTSLPIKDNSVDAVSCNHVFYQIPDPEDQATAFREVWRVLKPGGVAAVVYWWANAPLPWRVERVLKLFVRPKDHAPPNDTGAPTPTHEPQTLKWFQRRKWPFRYRLESYRIIPNQLMQRYVSDDWRGKLFLDMLYTFQNLAPEYCGKYGVMPVILIYKD